MLIFRRKNEFKNIYEQFIILKFINPTTKFMQLGYDVGVVDLLKSEPRRYRTVIGVVAYMKSGAWCSWVTKKWCLVQLGYKKVDFGVVGLQKSGVWCSWVMTNDRLMPFWCSWVKTKTVYYFFSQLGYTFGVVG